MKNSAYWKLRFEQLEEAQNRQGAAVFAEIEKQYKEAQKQLEGEIARWYQRFADNNGITLAQARGYLKGADLEEFKWDVQDYIKYGQENALTGGWMKELENASAKYHISKLEALKIQTQQSLEVMFFKQLGTVTKAMGSIFESGYYHTAYELQKGFNIGWDIAGLNQAQIEKVISKPWAVDGKNFSERIWANKEKLISELHGELTQSIMLGTDPQKAIDSLAKKMNTSKYNAGRLIMTEEAYFSSAAQRDCFNELDVEQYEIVATLDSHTSDICRSLDGKHFPMKDFQPGITAPPFHVYCRSTTVPYFDEDFGDIEERTARDVKTGETYHVPADMTYEQWKELQDAKYGVGTVDKMRKMAYNKSADQEQFKKYKSLLGSNAPQSLEEFQQIKYSDDYISLKLQYANGRIQERIKTGKINTTVLIGKQGKHIKGHNNFIAGRSYLNASEDVQALVDKFAGTGTILRDASGKWTHKEVVKADHRIGFAVSQHDGSTAETSMFTIHYSRNGVHIVPKKE